MAELALSVGVDVRHGGPVQQKRLSFPKIATTTFCLGICRDDCSVCVRVDVRHRCSVQQKCLNFPQISNGNILSWYL